MGENPNGYSEIFAAQNLSMNKANIPSTNSTPKNGTITTTFRMNYAPTTNTSASNGYSIPTYYDYSRTSDAPASNYEFIPPTPMFNSPSVSYLFETPTKAPTKALPKTPTRTLKKNEIGFNKLKKTKSSQSTVPN